MSCTGVSLGGGERVGILVGVGGVDSGWFEKSWFEKKEKKIYIGIGSTSSKRRRTIRSLHLVYQREEEFASPVPV